jgi:hypothetical protein
MGPPEATEEQVGSFRPHLLACNDAHGEKPFIREDILREIPCCMEVLYTDGMDARLNADGRVTEMRNATTEDLLQAVDEAAEMAEREGPPDRAQGMRGPIPRPPR